jgi:hypothetical protein
LGITHQAFPFIEAFDRMVVKAILDQVIRKLVFKQLDVHIAEVFS